MATELHAGRAAGTKALSGEKARRGPLGPLTPASELPFHLHVEVLGLEREKESA